MKASTHTLWNGGNVVNEQVVQQIRLILGQEYCVYGYQMMTIELRSLGYLINAKKVYRLMDEHRLLNGKVIRTQGKRRWVKYRRIKANRPMEYLCLDIKHVWVHGENRWYYQLAIMDVYSRRILCWIFQPSVKQSDVIALMRWLDLRYGLKGVFIRNDNGSQFLANKVRQTLQDLEALQEFTHVATPEENSFIEAYHSIVERTIERRYEFESIYDAALVMNRWKKHYNEKRLHGSLGDKSPQQIWNDYYAGINLLEQPTAAKLEEKSRPVVNGTCEFATNASYRLEFSESEDIFAKSREKTVQNRLTNIELLSSF